MHDFVDPSLGKAIPYGVCDIGRNEGWVSVGVTHDTAEFAVATIRRWWLKMGRRVYPHAQELLITAVVAATVLACGYGRGSYRGWLMTWR